MTKRDAEISFREHYMPAILACEASQGCGGVDGPMRREAWNNYTDMLCKDGEITDAQYAQWDHPRWLESDNPLGSHWRPLLGR